MQFSAGVFGILFRNAFILKEAALSYINPGEPLWKDFFLSQHRFAKLLS